MTWCRPGVQSQPTGHNGIDAVTKRITPDATASGVIQQVEVLQRYSNYGDPQMRRSAAIRGASPMKTPDGNQTARRLPRRVEKLTEQQVR